MRKRLIIFAAILVIGVIIVSLLMYAPTLVKDKLTVYLKDKYCIDSKVNLVSFSFPVAITFHDINVYYKETGFTARKLTLYFDPIRLLKKQGVVRSLRRISSYKPEIITHELSSLLSVALPVQEPAKGSALPGELTVDWQNGKVKSARTGSELAIDRGKLVLSKMVQSAEITLDIKDTGKIKGKLVADKSKNFWDLKVTGKELKLHDGKTVTDFLEKEKLSSIDLAFYARGRFPSQGNSKGILNFSLESPKAKAGNLRMEGAGNFNIVTGVPEFKASLSKLKYTYSKEIYSGKAELVFSSGAFRITGFKLSNGQEDVSAAGNIKKQNMDLKIDLANFDINKFNGSLKGRINAGIFVRGNIYDPQIKVRADASNAEIFKGALKIDKSSFSLDYKSGKYKFNGTVNFTDKKYTFFVSAQSSQNEKNGGKSEFTGNAGVTGEGNNIKTGFYLSPELFELKNCRLIDKSGKSSVVVTARSELLKESKRNYKLEAKVREFIYEEEKVSGSVFSSGMMDTAAGIYSGELKVSGFKLNKFEMREIHGKFEYANNTLSLDNFRADDYVYMNCSYALESNKLAGTGTIKNFNMERFNVGGLSGELNCQFAVSGSLSSPLIALKYNTSGASYKKTDFESSGSGLINAEKISAKGAVSVARVNGGYDFSLLAKSKGKRSLHTRVNFNRLKMETLNAFLESNFGFRLPLKGDISSLAVEINGDTKSPEITVKTGSNSLLYTSKFLPGKWDNFELSGKLMPGTGGDVRLEIDNLNIETDEQRVSVMPGTYVNFSGAGSKFNVNLNLENYDFGMGTVYGKLAVAGDFEKTPKSFTVNSVANLANLWVNQQNIKDTSVGIKYTLAGQKSTVEFLPSKCKNCNIYGKIYLADNKISFSNIKIQSRDKVKNRVSVFKFNGVYSKDSMNIAGEGSNVNLDYMLRMADAKIPLDGIMDFSVVARGALQKPYLTGTVNVSAGDIYSIPFTNTNVNFNYNGQVLAILSARIVKLQEGREILVVTGNGKIPFLSKKVSQVASKNIDLNFEVEKGDLSILATMTEEVKSATGNIGAKIRISGNVTQPVYGGQIVVSDGNIKAKRYFDSLERLNIGIAFTDNKLEIKECSGKIGQGKFVAGGYLTFGGLFEVDECNIFLRATDEKGTKIFVPELPISVSAILKTTRIENIIKEYSSGEPRFDLSLKGKSEDMKLSGYIQLDDTHFCYPPPEKASGKGLFSDIFKSVTWDVEIRSGKNTWYENDLASVNIYGSLKLTGKSPNSVVNGQIESSRGKIEYLGKLYELKQAMFEVKDNDCFLEATAETSALFAAKVGGTSKEIGTVTMTISRSPISEITPKFSSADYPEMATDELVRRTMGFSEDMTPEEQNYMLRKQVVRLFDAALTSAFAKGIMRKIGIDSFHATPIMKGNENPVPPDPGATPSPSIDLRDTQYEITKILNRDLVLGYTLDLGKLDIRHEFELLYRWKGNVWVRTTYGYEPTKSYNRSDVQSKIETQWRFRGFEEKEKKSEKNR